MLTSEPEDVLIDFANTMKLFEDRFRSEVEATGADPNRWIQDCLGYARRAYQERPDEGTKRRLGAIVAFGEQKGLLPENYH